MATSRSAAAARQSVVSLRRRGSVLERAILEAALEALSKVGWNGLTMEGVAAGAQTGKAAIYRRWSSKEELVAEALRTALPALGLAPDSGNVRDDLHQLCRAMRDAMLSTSGSALRSVIHECDGVTAERFQSVILNGVIRPSTDLIREVVSRGVERGEVRAGALRELAFDVIPAMMMYRTKVCGSVWDDEEIEALIDQVVVPVFRPDAP
ncbi:MULTISPECIES: TetR/AcrR family transcriptional regulator [unclassified Streptomyces]|uniref:TetR/AcrR family transcriptional regulator n=1 Tax=unclassified Streptomyces TaxID=2593676 RepID=UPI0004763F0E|nr:MULTISPECIES: TetR/AcrR family transcriptional regulator [unclassified Streptomyces]MYY01148.1 TetR family transcriptional regulator [Streptomyces sp. SID4913]